jgi:hypothetical protein
MQSGSVNWGLPLRPKRIAMTRPGKRFAKSDIVQKILHNRLV